MRKAMMTVTAVAMMWSHAALAAEETLQNDGFSSGAPVNFQAGFIASEIAAARFEPQIACPCVVERVTILFGGSAETQDVGVLVWEDAAGADAPGALVFSGEVGLMGSNVLLQEIDLTLSAVVVNGPFRVGFEFTHNGLPGVATDLDGTIDAGANFILADIGVPFWFRSASLGVSGDFVIRASVNNFVVVDTDGDGVADDADNCTGVANAGQQDSNGDGFGNACDADLNNDCGVNLADLILFKNVFATAAADADFNSDGTVNLADLVAFKALFASPPGPSGVPNACDGG